MQSITPHITLRYPHGQARLRQLLRALPLPTLHTLLSVLGALLLAGAAPLAQAQNSLLIVS